MTVLNLFTDLKFFRPQSMKLENWVPFFPDSLSTQVKRTPQDYINEFIIRKLNPLVVVDFRFISAFLHA